MINYLKILTLPKRGHRSFYNFILEKHSYLDSLISSLASHNCSLNVTCMSHHITIWQVDADLKKHVSYISDTFFVTSHVSDDKIFDYLVKLPTKYSIPCLFSNFQSFHFWLHIESDSTITWNFNIFLQLRVKTP